MLDEPTNNLDMASVRQLTSALESYEGALIVASHDLPFLESIGITRWLLLDVAERVLPGLDDRLAATADRVLRERGVDVRMGVSVAEATMDGVSDHARRRFYHDNMAALLAPQVPA